MSGGPGWTGQSRVNRHPGSRWSGVRRGRRTFKDWELWLGSEKLIKQELESRVPSIVKKVFRKDVRRYFYDTIGDESMKVRKCLMWLLGQNIKVNRLKLFRLEIEEGETCATDRFPPTSTATHPPIHLLTYNTGMKNSENFEGC